MADEIRYPEHLAARLFDVFYEGKEFENRTIEYVNGGCERLDELPGSEKQIRGLKKLAREQTVRDSWTLLKLKKYAEKVPEDKKTDNAILNASEVLRDHVSECRDLNGCFESYDAWLVQKAKEIMEDERISTEDFPKIKRKIDLRTLDLLNF